MLNAIHTPLPYEQKTIHISDIGNYIRNLYNRSAKADPHFWRCWLKTFMFSTLAGPEEYRRMGISVKPHVWDKERRPSFMEQEGMVLPEGPVRIRIGHNIADEARKFFPVGPIAPGEHIQLTIATLYEVLQRPPVPWEQEVLDTNIGHAQWSVAAFILTVGTYDAAIVEWMYQSDMFKTPIWMWKTVYGDWYNALRRIGALRIDGAIVADIQQTSQVRKIFNVCYRDMEDAPFEEDMLNRTENLPVQFYLNKNGTVSTASWTVAVWRKCCEAADLIVGGMADGPTLDDMDEWWAARWAHAPTGASTLRRCMNDIKSADDTLTSAARGGKKAVWEELPSYTGRLILEGVPPAGMVNKSTKNEPSEGKNRVLLSLDDINMIVASYASVHMEKFMNVWGMKAKQAPGDVVEWINVGVYLTCQEMWLSLDYSDYNAEHMQQTLVMWNAALARAWKNCGIDPKVKADKIRATAWVGMAHMHHYAKTDDKLDAERLLATLCSGHRDTARDNTALHGVYSKIVSEMMREVDPLVEPRETFFTGDDEDGVHRDVYSTAHYMLGHRIANFTLNAAKQAAGRRTHEFLQRECVPGKLPLRPLAAAMAQLASGNWYQDVHIWYDNAVASVSDNVWELHTRGLPIAQARRLAVSVLNATMRVPQDDGTYKKLEWWRYRHGNSIHPLWAGLSGGISTPHSIEAKPYAHPVARRQATKDWCSSREKRVGIRLKEEARAKYLDDCAKESYSSLYVRERSQKHRRYALDRWEERYSIIPQEEFNKVLIERVEDSVIAMQLPGLKNDRRPATYDEILSRLGLDSKFVEAAGGIDRVFQHLAPKYAAKYENPIVPRLLPIQYQSLDGAIKSWIKTAWAMGIPTQQHREARYRGRHVRRLEYQAPLYTNSSLVAGQITVIIAPNAAGKTTYASKHYPLVGDMDEIVGRSGYRRALNSLVKAKSKQMEALLYLDFIRYMSAGSKDIFCTQWPLERWLPPRDARTWEAIVYIVDVPEELRRARLQERKWPEDKINRRLERWRDTVEQYKNGHGLSSLSQNEKTNIKYLQTFDKIQ